jgi:hypothetical protein
MRFNSMRRGARPSHWDDRRCNDPTVSLFDRIRRFWGSGSTPDHPISEEERDEEPPATAYDARARVVDDYVGDDFDPDDSQPHVR